MNSLALNNTEPVFGRPLTMHTDSQYFQFVPGLSNKCLNGITALKQIYVRYLERYERINYFGDVMDRMDEEDDEAEPNRHRKLSTRSLHSVPQTYNYSQHNLPGKVAKRMTNELMYNLFCFFH